MIRLDFSLAHHGYSAASDFPSRSTPQLSVVKLLAPLGNGRRFCTNFSSNITRDAETGIGWWPEEAFRRAMRSGVNRDGQPLYPTFPNDPFTNVTGEDDHALYAYLMSRKPGSRSLRVAEDRHRQYAPGRQRRSIRRLNLCKLNTARLSLTSGAQQSDDHSHKN